VRIGSSSCFDLEATPNISQRQLNASNAMSSQVPHISWVHVVCDTRTGEQTSAVETTAIPASVLPVIVDETQLARILAETGARPYLAKGWRPITTLAYLESQRSRHQQERKAGPFGVKGLPAYFGERDQEAGRSGGGSCGRFCDMSLLRKCLHASCWLLLPSALWRILNFASEDLEN
jgi:hypothetical protein